MSSSSAKQQQQQQQKQQKQHLASFSETKAVVAIAGSLLLPIPFLTTLNKCVVQYPLDRLHYLLFQILFFVMLPSIISVAGDANFAHKVEVVRRSGRHSPQRDISPQVSRSPSAAAFKVRDKEHSVAGALPTTHRYTEKCAEVERVFMKLASQDDTAPGSPWTPLVSQTAPYPVTVQGHKTKPFCFRITFYAPTLPGTAFDLLANILRRPEWDELTETTRIVDQLSQADSIHYLKMKPVWPTAARDSVLISHIASVKLGGSEKAEEAGDGAEYGYLNASQSIEDDRVPERKEEGIVRMEAGIAGQLVTLATKEDKERLGLVGENWCKVVQLADGDLKGWIPKSVIKFIATQALPRSLTKVSKQLAGMQHGMESQLIRNLTIPAAKAYSATAAPPSSSSVPTAASSASAPAARRTVHHSSSDLVRLSRAGWMPWIKIILRYAGPAVIASITSLVFNLLWQRRRR